MATGGSSINETTSPRTRPRRRNPHSAQKRRRGRPAQTAWPVWFRRHRPPARWRRPCLRRGPRPPATTPAARDSANITYTTTAEICQRSRSHVMPGQQQTDGQRRQQEVLREAERVEQLAQPDVGAVAHRLRPEDDDPAFVQHQQRHDKRQAGQRPARLPPIARQRACRAPSETSTCLPRWLPSCEKTFAVRPLAPRRSNFFVRGMPRMYFGPAATAA